MSLDKVLTHIVQKIEGRFYGKYRGLVVDNADPEKLGRLKVQVPSVLGNSVVSGWALPCVPYGGDADQGFLFIPEVGAGVWVEFEEGDLEFPIWVGAFWSKPNGESELPKPNKPDGSKESAVQDPVTRKIIKTKAGHTIQMEDNNDGDKAQVIIVEGIKGHVILLDKEGITIVDANKNKIKMDDKGIVCTDKNSNEVLMDNSGVTVKGSKIKIGDGASEPLVLGNQLKSALDQWINSTYAVHMHTGNLGAPTTPPTPGAPLVLDPALSQTNTVK